MKTNVLKKILIIGDREEDLKGIVEDYKNYYNGEKEIDYHLFHPKQTIKELFSVFENYDMLYLYLDLNIIDNKILVDIVEDYQGGTSIKNLTILDKNKGVLL